MKIVIIGLGLIGGSIGKDLKMQLNVKVIGIDNNALHRNKALSLGLVHEVSENLDILEDADYAIIAVPVDKIQGLLSDVLDRIGKECTVIDVGSTKTLICATAFHHPKRAQFIASHPLAGTEYSGPDAAISRLFNGKKNIICQKELSAHKHLEKAVLLFESLGMTTHFMTPEDHDLHMAYISHLSHVSSFMLGKTVLDKERDASTILDLASTGFASTVRLAKSHPDTWIPIFRNNKTNILAAIDNFLCCMHEFRSSLENDNFDQLYSMIQTSNNIKKILN